MTIISSSRLYALEIRYEFLKLIRQPAYSLGTIGFPLMFYVLFGLSLNHDGQGPKASEYCSRATPSSVA